MKPQNDEFKEIKCIEGFRYPVACTGIKITDDEKHILTLGTYMPSARIYDLNSLALRVERHTVTDALQISPLCQNGEKFMVLRVDRSIEFHTRNGLHDSVRTPCQPRSILFNPNIAECYASGEYDSIYRFSLEQGRFLREIPISNVIQMALSSAHGLLAGIKEQAVVFIDPRAKAEVIQRPWNGSPLASFALSPNGTNYMLGSSEGELSLFDLRASKPESAGKANGKIQKIIYNGKTAIFATGSDIKAFQDGRQTDLISADFKINDFDSLAGLIVFGGEAEEMKCYFSEMLGPVPEWCSNAVIS